MKFYSLEFHPIALRHIFHVTGGYDIDEFYKDYFDQVAKFQLTLMKNKPEIAEETFLRYLEQYRSTDLQSNYYISTVMESYRDGIVLNIYSRYVCVIFDFNRKNRLLTIIFQCLFELTAIQYGYIDKILRIDVLFERI